MTKIDNKRRRERLNAHVVRGYLFSDSCLLIHVVALSAEQPATDVQRRRR